MSEPESSDGQQPKSITEPVAEPETVPEPVAEPETNGNSHLFSVRTTGGQEKIVMRLLEARMKMDSKDEEEIEKEKVVTTIGLLPPPKNSVRWQTFYE